MFPGVFVLVALLANRMAANRISNRTMTLRLAFILLPIGIFVIRNRFVFRILVLKGKANRLRPLPGGLLRLSVLREERYLIYYLVDVMSGMSGSCTTAKLVTRFKCVALSIPGRTGTTSPPCSKANLRTARICRNQPGQVSFTAVGT